MVAFKEKWPTPAETITKHRSNNTVQNHPVQMDYTNNIYQLHSNVELSKDISFLQPSVVFPLCTTDTLFDPNPISNIHMWGETLEEEKDVGKQIHPAILSQLKPCKTEKDHNCLYNAICLCIGMPESQQYVLREKTASCLQRHSDHFTELLKASDEISFQALLHQCKQPSCFEGWGNEFHILALSIALKRNIVVYTTFTGPKGQFYQRKNKNIVGLAEEFAKGGEKIEQHTNFQPQQGITCHNPIFVYLNGNHFTALVPRLPQPIYCVPPATNLPSIPNNGMSLTLHEASMQTKKLTRKVRWLASKTPTQFAEYKAREKAKKKERKASQVCEHTVKSGKQGRKQKCVKQGYDEGFHKDADETKESATVLSFTTTDCTATKQQNAKCHGKRKVTELSSQEDKSRYKKKRQTENNSSIVPPTQTYVGKMQQTVHPSKMTKGEINRRYYEKHKDKIKEARTEKCEDPEKHIAKLAARRKSYREPVKHAAELTKRKAAYAVPEKRMAKLAAKRMSYRNPVKHAAVLAKGKAAYAVPEKRLAKLAAKRMSYRNPAKHAAVLAKGKAAYAVPEKHKAKLAAERTSYRNPLKHATVLAKRKEAYAVPEKHNAKLAAERTSYRNPVIHATVLAKRKAAYAEPGKRTAKLAGKRKFYENPVNRDLVLAKQRILYKRQVMTEPKKIKPCQKVKRSDYDYLLSQARKEMMEMPILACTVCHRARFKEQVRLCHRNKYPQSETVLKCFTGKYIHQCPTDCSDTSIYHQRKKKEWICFTCHRHLLKGNMPPQAAINNLWLDDMPQELKILNPLEMHLVSIVQPFMKIVPLPKGGQKGVRGQMVCVPANLQRTADSLPWTLNPNNLIRVKLKRKQEYKGHHLYMVVSQQRVMSALRKLMEINPAYKGK